MHFPPGRCPRPGRPGFWERPSRPRYSPFRGPASPSLAVFPAAKRRLYQGPPRATKVQQLLIFGVPPSPDEAVQRSDRLLPAVTQPGGPARFSPGFRVLSQKRGRWGLARGCFPFFEWHFPTYYVDLACYFLVIGNISSYIPIFLCNPPPDAISPPQRGREPR